MLQIIDCIIYIKKYMPHISNKILNPEQMKKLKKELVRAFERASADVKTSNVFYEFFTHTEKIMFAKRLAVITMLKKGVSHYMISVALGVSPSTVARLSLRYEKGRYEHILKHAVGKRDFLKVIESILTLEGIVPPIAGKGRWRMLDREIHRKNLKKG